MSRRTPLLVTVDATLVATTPLHVGAAAAGIGTDLVVARDGADRVVLPGTSLAGVLRTWAADHLDLDAGDLSLLFGGSSGDAGASRIVVDDAPAQHHVAVEVRDHVGLDRRTGTAATGIKYDRQVVPAGTRFSLHLEAEAPVGGDSTTADLTRAVVAHLIDAVAGGEIRVGAAGTRGLGGLGATDIEVRAFDLATPQGMLTLLDHRTGQAAPTVGDDQLAAWRDAVARRSAGRHVIEVAWRAATPVVVHDAERGEAIDHFPLTTAVPTEDGTVLRLVLPGSSVKGVLRSHAERIVRTVLGHTTPEATGPVAWLDQLDVPLLDRLFGLARPADRTEGARRDDHGSGGANAVGGGDGSSGRVAVGAGLLGVDDCVADGPDLDPVRWAALRARPKPDKEDSGPLQQALEELGASNWVIAYHVGIDRWTGGAADNLLFTSLEPHDVAWPPLRLDLRTWPEADPADAAAVARHEEERLASLALVALVLSDLHTGWLGFGHGVNRGNGGVEVTGISIDGNEVDLTTSPPIDAVLEALGEPADAVRAAWASWIERQAGGD